MAALALEDGNASSKLVPKKEAKALAFRREGMEASPPQ